MSEPSTVGASGRSGGAGSASRSGTASGSGSAGRRAEVVPTADRLVWHADGHRFGRAPDALAVEEPLELRVDGGTGLVRVNVTMRTPGHDFELALGWLLAEGFIDGPEDVSAVRYCTDPELDAEQRYNVVTVDLRGPAAGRLLAGDGPAGRLVATSSSCGVCGSGSIEAIAALGVPPVVAGGTTFSYGAVLSWPKLLRERQAGFVATGGLHAAGLVGASEGLLVAREDIGRHNAVDKAAGWLLTEALEGRREFPASGLGLVVSGRISFEIVQKALRLGVAVLAAVSAASGLAARLADENGLCLVGFVRGESATVYTHPSRLTLP